MSDELKFKQLLDRLFTPVQERDGYLVREQANGDGYSIKVVRELIEAEKRAAVTAFAEKVKEYLGSKDLPEDTDDPYLLGSIRSTNAFGNQTREYIDRLLSEEGKVPL